MLFCKIKKILLSMNYSPILLVNGEPNSVFLEIFFKSLKSQN